jgi:GT2 family glycosyltransferase
VIVVDNASTDTSLEELGKYPFRFRVIRNSENLGFGVACNQGALASNADYLLFLNPDTLLTEHTIIDSIKFMEDVAHANIGILGIQLVGDDDTISRTCTHFPSPVMFLAKTLGLDKVSPILFPSYNMTEWDHKTSREVDHVIGAFYFVRRSLFESLNGFDKRFFVYLEDLDFSLRAHKLGWKSFYLADTKAYHKGGGVSEQVMAKRLFYSRRSRIQYICKHFRKNTDLIIILSILILEPFMRILLACLKFSGSQITETISGYRMLWSELPEFIKDYRG